MDKNILSLLGLESHFFTVDPTIEETESEIIIYAELLDDSPRICPHCNSHSVIIKDKELVTLNMSAYSPYNTKKIILSLKKRKYHCKKCGKNFSQDNKIAGKRKTNSNATSMAILIKTQEAISFSQIARELKISEGLVRTIFNSTKTEGRKALTKVISIDEKSFKSEFGKYACIISNALTGDVLDVLPSRTYDYLFDHFQKISKQERQTVKFFVSDMFEGYRTIKKLFFPDAIHIIDKFHITKLFTEALQKIRTIVMNGYDKKTNEYKFLKSNRKLFLLNPYSEKGDKVLSTQRYNSRKRVEYTYKDVVQKYAKKDPILFEIYNLYSDYCQYFAEPDAREKLEISLSFIIEKCLNSTSEIINTLGSTLYNFFDEIINTFSDENTYSITNAIAESNNSKIARLNNATCGIRTFSTFRKRILHLKKPGE